MMRRGIVLKLKNDYALIATDDSDFIRVKIREGMRVGQKIFVLDEDIISLEKHKKRSGISSSFKFAAALAACIVIAVIINNPFIKDTRHFYAMVSIDINPSFQLGIDEAYKVVQVDAMNEESKKIVDSELIGESLSVAVSKILSDVEESGYVLDENNAVLVSTVNFKSDDDEPLQKVVADGVRLAMSQNKVYESTKIIFVEADGKDFIAAEEQELSVGKYRLLEMSDNKIDKKAIEEGRVSDLIKEEEIKDDLEADKTIQIIDGGDLKKLNLIEQDLKNLEDKVKQMKDVLDSNDFEKIEVLFNKIKIIEKQFINEEPEFKKICEGIEKLHQIIELKEDKDYEDENLDSSYEVDETIKEEEDEDMEEELLEEEEDKDIDEEELLEEEEAEDMDEEELLEEEEAEDIDEEELLEEEEDEGVDEEELLEEEEAEDIDEEELLEEEEDEGIDEEELLEEEEDEDLDEEELLEEEEDEDMGEEELLEEEEDEDMGEEELLEEEEAEDMSEEELSEEEDGGDIEEELLDEDEEEDVFEEEEELEEEEDE